MVQIMNGSGHCSRNRAERASLDGKPEYPDGTSFAPNQTSEILQSTLIQTPDAKQTVVEPEEEEYEAYGQNGTQSSILRNHEETNNNLSDSEKDGSFIVADPWAAAAAFVTPQFDDEEQPDEDPLKPDNIETPSASVTSLAINTENSDNSYDSIPTTSTSGSNSKRTPSTKRRRKISKGSSSGASTISCRSTKSLQSARPKSTIIPTRRRSTQSTCSTEKNMEIDFTRVSKNLAGDDLEYKHPVDDGSIVASTSTAIPSCYRCQLKFAKYSHWKKHAIYKHILVKNPYPIVEMNYIDPQSLGIVVTPSTEEVESSTFDEENAFVDESTLGDSPEGGATSEAGNHGRLRLCIGKEKSGVYVVKEKKSCSQSSLDINSDDSCPPILEAPSPNPRSSCKNPSSPDLIMPMLKPCPALTTPPQQYQIMTQKLTQANLTTRFASTPPPLVCQTADLETRYRSMVSIESELETVFNIGMDEDFETALEVAMERSRVDNLLSGGIGNSGGVVGPFNSNPNPSTSTTMISEEVSHTSSTCPIVSKATQLLEQSTAVEDADPRTKDSLLNRLLNRDNSSEVTNLVKANKCDNSDSRSIGKDSDEKQIENGKDEQPCQNQSETEETSEDKPTENSDTNSDKNLSPVKDLGDTETPSTQIPSVSEDDGDKEGESDALECRVCKKVFQSDDELNEHFSKDHFRLAEGMGILEPESPYPPPQTPQQNSIFLADDDEQIMEPVRSHASEAPHQHPAPVRSFTMNVSNLNRNAGPPPNVSLPQPHPNFIRRLSNDSGLVLHHHPPSYNGQETWRSQANAAAALNTAHAQQQRADVGIPRGFPSMNTNPLNPGNLRPMAPPNMAVGGMTPSIPNNQQSMSRQSQQSQIHFSNSSTGPGPQYGMRGQVHHHNQQPRLPIQAVQAHNRGSPPQYPTSLHNALTMGTLPHYSSASASIRSSGILVQQQLQQSNGNNRAVQPGGPMRQMHPNPYQQNALRGMPSNSTVRAQPGQLGQTIGMNQQMLNQMNAQRELNSQFQQRHVQPHPIMPRLQQSPQQRSVPPYPNQQYRPSPLSQKRPAPGPDMSMSCIEISDVRPSKIARPTENSRPIVPNGSSSNNSSPGPINQNVAAAIGSVGSAGINSVRLGNSITLSVCPTSSANSPATSPALHGEHLSSSSNQPTLSGSPSAPMSPSGHHMSSVLAVRGITVTPASPPITTISPASSPSPSHSPGVHSVHQQIHHYQPAAASVIQRGPGSISPENSRDKNFSPPVITTVRGNVHPLPNNMNPHNFAVPRAPPPIHRGMMGQGVPHQQLQHSPSYAVNASADRPERPPTVDLTGDNSQAPTLYNQQTQQRVNGGIPQHQNQQSSAIRFVAAQTANFPQTSGQHARPLTARMPSCNICSLVFPSIQKLEQHKLTQHNVPRTNPQPVPSATSPSAGSGGIRPQIPPPVGQVQQSRPPASAVRSVGRPPFNPGHAAQHRPLLAPGPNTILRHQQPEPSQMQIRSQSPNRPSIPNSPNQNQGKYLYIPLLDLGRLDANKMRKLEEIGISCVVPLQGNNAMTSMGIPVMSLREGASSQNNVPWDSVLPMGPVMGPVHALVNEGNNRGNNPNNNNANHTRIP